MNNKKGRVLPAEWSKQSGVQLTWPHAGTDWSPYMQEANACFAEIADAIAAREVLLIVCVDKELVLPWLDDDFSNMVRWVELPLNDTWARDHGGITIFEDGYTSVLDFKFNGWGLKFAADQDNMITERLFAKGAFADGVDKENRLSFVLEGGGIESDGEGTLLTTWECLMSANRNGGSSEDEIEDYLIKAFGLKRVLWLHYGYLAGDDTDSHVDTLARFCSPTSIAYVACDDVEDEHYLDLKAMELELKGLTTLSGEPYQLFALPMADAVVCDGERLPATYANFLIINMAVLMPTYGTDKDYEAIAVLQQAFPDREVVGIDCSVLIKQHGSLHCVTMQYPEGVLV